MPPWPADKVERWRIDRLVPCARNSRRHSDAQVAQIAASIREWGRTVPAIVDEQGGLIAGHARVMAAHRLGLTEVPVVIALGWNEPKSAPTSAHHPPTQTAWQPRSATPALSYRGN